jgi:iron(III) transport system substrate-binding protein
MNPSLAYFSVTGLVKGGPHPAAAKLFIDFLISEDGQELVRDADYIPVDPAVPPRDASLRPDGTRFTAVFFTPEDIAAKMPIWLDIFKDLFR